MPSTKLDQPAVKSPPSRGRWFLVFISVAALAWSLPRPLLHDVVVGHLSDNSSSDSSNETKGRLAFRTARRLSELAAKGPLADETELSGPCLTDGGQSLYFARSRPGQRADIMLARREGEQRWSRAEPVRELNSVDDDRRVTIAANEQTLVLASNRSGTRGGFDLYESSRVRDHWIKPKNVGESLNTTDDEFDPTLSTDGLTLYFVRKLPGETADIFESHRTTLTTEWSAPQAIAAINSPSSHERSPAISPDGKFVYFASNRTRRSGDESQFDLFRAPLQNGIVGSPVRVQDGIATAADDVDAAFSADGRTLIFASKREGPKQLYLSQADVVETRLGWDTEHLARFGRAKWGVPVLSSVFFLWVIRRARRSVVASATIAEKPKVAEPPKNVKADKPLPLKRTIEPTTSSERRVETIDQPKQRSSAPKNPLANWTIESSSISPASNSSKAKEPPKSDSTRMSDSVTTTSAPITRSKNRRRSLEVLVAIALTAAWLIAFKPNWWMPVEPTSLDHDSLTNFVQFRDITATRQAEHKPTARTTTARTTAPTAASEPSELTSLRQAALWPNTLFVVRSKTVVDPVANELPELVRMVKQLAIARQSISSSMLSTRDSPAEVAVLVGSSVVPEKVIGTTSTIFVKQLVDLSPQQRALLPEAVATNSMLRLPQSRAVQVAAAAISKELTTTQVEAMPRNGAASRANMATGLAQAESSLPLNVVAVSEPSLVPQSLALNRSSVTEVGSVPVVVSVRQTSPTSTVVARPIVVIDASRDTAEVGFNKSTSLSPIARQTAEPKFVPIVEEPVSQTPNPTNAEILVAAKLPQLSRTDTNGPMSVTLASTATLETTANRTVLTRRNDASVDTVVLPNLAEVRTSKIELLVPRELPQKESLVANVDAEVIKTNNNGPALLLTSATQLAELLPPSILSAMAKFQAVGPLPTLAFMTDSVPTKWLPQIGVPRTNVELRELRGEATTTSVGSSVSIPRLAKESLTAGIVEEVKPVDP